MSRNRSYTLWERIGGQWIPVMSSFSRGGVRSAAGYRIARGIILTHCLGHSASSDLPAKSIYRITVTALDNAGIATATIDNQCFRRGCTKTAVEDSESSPYCEQHWAEENKVSCPLLELGK